MKMSFSKLKNIGFMNFGVLLMANGVTAFPAKGAYTGAEKTVIVTVVRRAEAIKLRRKILAIDPRAFIIINKTSEIMGKGYRDSVN